MKAYLALALAAVASIGMTASPQTVSAGEFAAMNCGELWVARNQIYCPSSNVLRQFTA